METSLLNSIHLSLITTHVFNMWEVMFWPIVACVLLPWLLVYLGLHVVQRGVIFVVIEMAQMASLGIFVALLFRFALHGWATFAIALGFTILAYASFGLVVTIFVRMAGVLLVFSYLIVPAVCVINLVSGIRARLFLGWIIATMGGIGGLFWSFYGDLPSGAAIVCTFGALLVGVSILGFLLSSKRD